MREYTIINQERFEKHISVKEAISQGRAKGFTGRIEIQHLIKAEHEEFLYALYLISEKNKIVSASYPYISLIRQLNN